MLDKYLEYLPDAQLRTLFLDTEKSYWDWVYRHCANPTEDTRYQLESWKQINFMVYGEMQSLERYMRNRNR